MPVIVTVQHLRHKNRRIELIRVKAAGTLTHFGTADAQEPVLAVVLHVGERNRGVGESAFLPPPITPPHVILTQFEVEGVAVVQWESAQ